MTSRFRIGVITLAALPWCAVTDPAGAQSSCTSGAHRQFDFWIGEWTVRTASGGGAGTSRVERTLDGCRIRESWEMPDGTRGYSTSAFDPASNQWHQTMSDNTGLRLALSGGVINGEMVLEGQRQHADGRETLERITWSPAPDGSIRQLWQSSESRGMRWVTVLDATWRLVRR